MVTYDAKRIVAVTKNGITNYGDLDRLATVAIAFAYEIDHPVFRRLTCSMIAGAHELAKLRQKQEVGMIDNVERLQMTELAQKVKRSGVTDTLQFVVQTMYDHICNWNTLCDTIQELNKNPFLQFTRALKRNGVATTLNPLEVETTANRRSERLFRGAE